MGYHILPTIPRDRGFLGKGSPSWSNGMTSSTRTWLNEGFLKWWYPKIMHFSRVFPYQPASYWGTPNLQNPQMVVIVPSKCVNPGYLKGAPNQHPASTRLLYPLFQASHRRAFVWFPSSLENQPSSPLSSVWDFLASKSENGSDAHFSLWRVCPLNWQFDLAMNIHY